MARILYLDQNAWVALAKGAWDKGCYPKEHEALTKLVDCVDSGSVIAPMTFANIYETVKINRPDRRFHMACVQSLISKGRVFRSRRRIFIETLANYLARKFVIHRPIPADDWFISDLWFEAAGDYKPETHGFEMSKRLINLIPQDSGRSLFDYLAFSDEAKRREAVRGYSAGAADLIARIEARRARFDGDSLALRKRAYSASLMIDELDCIFATAQSLGLGWSTVSDIGSSLTRSIMVDVPVLNVERELAVRLEDQSRSVAENDLGDMMSFLIALPLADVVVAERQFVNISRQAHLDNLYKTKMVTSIFDLFNEVN